MSIKVLLVEHQKLVRLGIASALERAEDIKLALEAEDSRIGLELYKSERPDVALLSLRLPESCAVDDIDDFFAADGSARIIVLAETSGDAEVSAALKKGALGFVTKDISPEELQKAIKVVASGSKYIPENIAGVLSEHLGAEELTKAERRTLEMMVGGMSNKEIGFALDVSENTVKTHVKNIFQKLGVSDRTTAATTAIKRGIVRIDVS